MLYSTNIGMHKQMKARERTRDNEVVDHLQRHLYALAKNLNSCDHECLSRYGVTAAQGYALLAFPKGSSTSMNELSRQWDWPTVP